MNKKIYKTILIIFVMVFNYIDNINCDDRIYENYWPKYGLVFQRWNDKFKASKRYYFYWGFREPASELLKYNPNGIYLPAYNICAAISMGINKFCPDIEYICKNHPNWILHYKNGSPVETWDGNHRWLKLDIGNHEYVEYAIKWVRDQINKNGELRSLGLDNAMFMYSNKMWAKYDTNEEYPDIWENFLKRVSDAFRPHHKIVLNVGGCDLYTFARMICHVDGVLHEDLCHPPHKPGFDPQKARRTILDRWEKGQWCMENGKIWAVRYNSTINALKLATTPKIPDAYISIGEKEILVSTSKQELLGKIILGAPQAETLAQLARTLEGLGLKVDILNPYAETSPAGTLHPVKYARIGEGLTLKFKQAPREAFLFGYAAVLMVAGPNSYYIIGDERHQEYYYPEMDLPTGAPVGIKTEISSNVYKRVFENVEAYLNLSDHPFIMPDGSELKPFRGALIARQGGPK